VFISIQPNYLPLSLYNLQTEPTNGDCYTVDYLQVYRIPEILSIAAPLEFLPLDTF
jgi:hypothetical protein